MAESRWNLTNTGIARELNVDVKTVRKWRMRFAMYREQLQEEGWKFPLDATDAIKDAPREGAPRSICPLQIGYIIQLVCERKADNRQRNKHDIPVKRLSVKDIWNILKKTFGPLTPARSSIQNILKRLDLRPWLNNSWLHIRDFRFFEKASVVLDLYHGWYNGERLTDADIVLCADEVCGLQVIERVFRTAAKLGQVMRIDFEYKRHGTITMHVARDIRTGKVYYKFPRRSTKAEFQKFVKFVMKQEPFKSAQRVFWVVDNGGCHHPNTFGPWLEEMWPGKAIAVHTPVHASWLNQIECFFSIMVRKALTPRDFPSKMAMKQAIIDWIEYYNESEVKPFNWKYTKQKLKELIDHLEAEGLLPQPTIDNIPNVGPQRRAALIKRFGDEEKIRMASIDDITSVPGFGPSLAQTTWEHLRA